MNKKIIILSLLLLTAFLAGCNSQANSQTTSLQENSQADKIEIIDFHGTRRCYSCETIEKFTKKTLEEFFQNEMEEGKITFQSINGELPENESIVIKYQARGSSLFLNAIKNGQDNIEEDVEVWRLVRDEQKFKEYLKNKLDNLLQ